MHSRDPPCPLGGTTLSRSSVRLSVSCSHPATQAPSSLTDSSHPTPDWHPRSTHTPIKNTNIKSKQQNPDAPKEKQPTRCSPALYKRCHPSSDRTATDCDDDGGCGEDDGGGKDDGPSPTLRPHFPAGLRVRGRVFYWEGWSGRTGNWRGRAGRRRPKHWCPGGVGGRWAACGETADCWRSVCRAPDPSQRCGVKTDGCCCADTRTTDSPQKHGRVTVALNQTVQTENSDSYLERKRLLWVTSIYFDSGLDPS